MMGGRGPHMEALLRRVANMKVDPSTGKAVRPEKPGYSYAGHLRDELIDQVEECIEMEERATEPPPPKGHPEDMLEFGDEKKLDVQGRLLEMGYEEVLEEEYGGMEYGRSYDDSYTYGQDNLVLQASASAPISVRCRSVPARANDHFNLRRPQPCGGHSAVFVSKDPAVAGDPDKIVVFGGYKYDNGKQHLFSNYNTTVSKREHVYYSKDVYWLDLSSSIWYQASVVGDLPAGRHGHSATMAGYRMWVYGGRGQGGRTLSDVHYLDIRVSRGSQVSVGGCSGSSSSSSSIFSSSSSSDSSSSSGDLHNSWPWVWSWHKIYTTMQPPPRALHTAVSVYGEKLLVFGGRAKAGHGLNDLWLLDLRAALEEHTQPVLKEVQAASVWTQPNDAGHRPKARFGHSMLLLPEENKILVLGGCVAEKGNPRGPHCEKRVEFYELDVATLMWGRRHEPPMCGQIPRSTFSHGCCRIGRFLLVFGGALPCLDPGVGDGDRCKVADAGGGIVAVLELGRNRWHTPDVLGDFPLPRYGLTMTDVGHRCVVFGGYDSVGGIDEVLLMEVPGAALEQPSAGGGGGEGGDGDSSSSSSSSSSSAYGYSRIGGLGYRSGPLSASAHSILGGMPSMRPSSKSQQKALGSSVSFLFAQ